MSYDPNKVADMDSRISATKLMVIAAMNRQMADEKTCVSGWILKALINPKEGEKVNERR